MMANLSSPNQVRPVQRTKQASASEHDRQQRLNRALRENLLKRKQQNRSRQKQQIKTKDSSAAKIKGMQD